MISEHRERLQEIYTLKQALVKSQENKAGCIREREAFSGETYEQRQVLLGLGEENNSIRKECGFWRP